MELLSIATNTSAQLIRGDILPADLLTFLIFIGTGIASNAVFYFIRNIVRRERKHKSTTITEIISSDGTKLLTVDISEGMTSEEASKIAQRIADSAQESINPKIKDRGTPKNGNDQPSSPTSD